MLIRTVSDLLKSAVSKDTHRLILCGVCEDADTDGTWRVSTDTHRLVAVRIGEGVKRGEAYKKVVYPEDVAIEAITAHYPNWRRVCPDEYTRSVDLYIPSLRVAIASAMAAARYNANRIRLKFDKSSAIVCGRSEEFGEAAFAMAMQRPIGVDDFEIALNGKFLLDSLPSFKDEALAWVRLEMTDSSKPVTITYPETTGLWQTAKVVIMPMAI